LLATPEHAPAVARDPARPLRLLLRGAWLLAHVLCGLALATAVNLDFSRRLRPEPLIQWWSRRLMRILNLRLSVLGQIPEQGCVLMANHVSWLDIPVIGAGAPTRFVSKSEVRDWPVAGWLANGAGTFYLRRGKGGSRPLLMRLLPYLQAGGSVTIFPEGTTTSGEGVLPFHARLFAAAIESGRPVVPVSLRYGPGSHGEALAPFVGDDDLLSHIVRLLGNRSLQAEVHFGRPLDPTGLSREALAEAARDAIRQRLTPLRTLAA
jgi:1-acyl-sn-glycerol-3-phosphate acyltransferase